MHACTSPLGRNKSIQGIKISDHFLDSAESVEETDGLEEGDVQLMAGQLVLDQGV